MRTFELSTRITAIGRSEGRTATAAAAYRACCAIRCEREGRTHDYRRKRGLEASLIVAPEDAPAWASNRSALWNAAELRERNGKRGPNANQFKADAKVAREFMFGFPAELSAEGRLQVATTIARHLVETHGIVADFAIHRPGKDGDERNFHCHMLTTTRRMTADGLTRKAREWDDLKSGAALSKAFRAFLATTMNAALAEEGQDGTVFVEHRSFKARGAAQRPQKHLGPNRTAAIRRELRENRTAALTANRDGQQERHEQERAALVARQQAALDHKLADLADRERQGIAAIEAAVRPGAAERQQASGLRRLFQAAGRDQAQGIDQQIGARPSIEVQVAVLRRDLQSERAAYLDSQARDRQALADRHVGEDRQLTAAAKHRVAHDRAVERQERQAQAVEQQRPEREQAPTRSLTLY